MQKVFPTLLIVLDVCAAVRYVPAGDWRRVRGPQPRCTAVGDPIYWLAAAVLTAVVTW